MVMQKFQNEVINKVVQEREEFFKSTILKHTKIKEPITKSKLKRCGITLCTTTGMQYIVWVEQRGVRIGDYFELISSAFYKQENQTIKP